MIAGTIGPEVSFDIASRPAVIAPGSVFTGAVKVMLNDGWHVNAHEPLDPFLIATELQFEIRQALRFAVWHILRRKRSIWIFHLSRWRSMKKFFFSLLKWKPMRRWQRVSIR